MGGQNIIELFLLVVEGVGKNVKFTPRNIMANWVFNESGFIVNPENRGN
jgi:hypothetical protein